MRVYLVDGYNFILQDRRSDALVEEKGLAAARQAFRKEAEHFGRRTRCLVRLVFDGAVDPMSHEDQFENEWVEVSFTSRDEKADERLVAVALELRRRGALLTIVSDDQEGVRNPLQAQGFQVMTIPDFTRLIRPGVYKEDPKGKVLSDNDSREIEARFLALDAERLFRESLKGSAGKAMPYPGTPERGGAGMGSSLPRETVPAPPAAVPGGNPPSPPPVPPKSSLEKPPPRPPDDPGRARRKERGLRKQARRLALLQSRRKSR